VRVCRWRWLIAHGRGGAGAQAELEAVLRAAGVPWATDPSNAKPVYKRNRVRLALAAHPHVRPAVMVLHAWAAAHSEHAYAHGACAAIEGSDRGEAWTDAGTVHALLRSNVEAFADVRAVAIRHDAAWAQAPVPVGVRALKAITGYVAGAAHPPDHAALTAAWRGKTDTHLGRARAAS
jgi:hypothetical protein